MKKIIITTTLLLFSLTSFSQASVERELSTLYKEAQSLMAEKDYESANQKFRDILKLGTKLPAEMPYLFAETLYYIEQYQNSKSFLEKYFEIMGTAGSYYDNALILKDKLEKELNVAGKCKYCDYAGYKLKSCPVCNGEKQLLSKCNHCEGIGKVGCTLCAGDGVIVQLGALGDKRYKTCHRCKGKGVHTCSICEGEKEFYRYCDHCLGKGEVSTDIICNHPDL